ncbi:hypothetical protein NH8B_0007 [Pseudogulbenkiania sp. NH8B]|uniref:hypothetical protein n=1 Tax=Pseudogulbenkiania sp. (strain NH8B) TaxID=748280 RepID=UPI00022796EF|nr:hypothetical protein [Pseudogulbenkiania sp. NH8B]BAK74856.1 hypothetical protein NH8B_0007 [Pseudogulbenkiania sp. NH8B]
MTETEYIIDWIHRVEHARNKVNFTKRLPTLLTEYFFEKVLASKLGLGIKSGLSTGWSYEYKHKNNERIWHKLLIEEKKLSPADKKFIQHAVRHNPEDRILLTHAKITSPTNKNNIPSIKFSTREIGLLNKKITLFEETEELKLFCQNINTHTNTSLTKLKTAKSNQPGIDTWLHNIATPDLQKILATRIFMNFLGKKVDIDSLMENEDGSISIIEFKRKDPAKGMKELEQKQIMQFIYKDPEEQKFIYDSLSYKKSLCFGLDISHVRNVEFCEKTGINYHHIIWEHIARRPGQIFSSSFECTEHQIKIYSINLTTNHFSGISTTHGEESGSYDDDDRFQLTIEKKLFSEKVLNTKSQQ